jgi:phosphopantothenoylcysteine decarboxylase/phosphopantothenate--cysteine ligase
VPSPAGQVRAAKTKQSAPRRVVITAGPTRARIDPVRYLSNDSSGKMGFEIARAAAERGDQVILIAGPVTLETPPGVTRVDVESARDMLAAVKTAFLGSESRAKGSFGKKGADALFMAAAVGDWRPKRRLSGKWRAKDGGDEVASLELVKNPDILAGVGRRKGRRLVVGFALETGSGLKRALAKLIRKSADYIVLNNETALGSNRTTVTILGKDGSRVDIKNKTKRDVARALVQLHHSSSAQAE